MLKRKYRLTRSKDFERVRRLGKSYAHPLMVLYALPNQQTASRFGVAAGRTVGNAVTRNRAKRVLRVAVSQLLPQVPSGWDLVLLARSPLSQAPTLEAAEGLRLLLQRAKLLSREEPVSSA